MENANNTANDIRSKDNTRNRNIYKYFKDEELAQLTNEEFKKLQTKMNLPHLSTTPTTAFFYHFNEGMDAEGLKGDETTLNIYKRLIAAHINYFPCLYRYSRIFSLCQALGVADVYDIGCGNMLQSLLLMYAPHMNYTGIDPYLFQDYIDGFMTDPDYINGLFEQFTGNKRIRYIKGTYPLDLTILENNIALLLYLILPEEKLKNMAEALSKDFERVVLTLPPKEPNLKGMDIKDIVCSDAEVWENPFEKYYALWKDAMPDFEFYRIGEPNCIFATRIPGDREKLEKNYTFIGDRVLTSAFDIPWHVMLMKPIINP